MSYEYERCIGARAVRMPALWFEAIAIPPSPKYISNAAHKNAPKQAQANRVRAARLRYCSGPGRRDGGGIGEAMIQTLFELLNHCSGDTLNQPSAAAILSHRSR